MFVSVSVKVLYHYALPLVTTVVYLAKSACPPDNVYNFVPVPESSYDRNYSSINKDGKRPLGYSKYRYLYNNADEPYAPCIKISGAKGLSVEIMVETEESRLLCFKRTDLPNKLTCTQLGHGILCEPSENDDIFVEFSCNEQCSQSDTRFWFRAVLGPSYSDDPERGWCDSRATDAFPDTLLTIPEDFVIPTQVTYAPRSSSSTHRKESSLIYLCVMLLNMIYLFASF